jgi:hypothetical protein
MVKQPKGMISLLQQQWRHGVVLSCSVWDGSENFEVGDKSAIDPA